MILRMDSAPEPEPPPTYTKPLALGAARVDLTKALQIAAEMEDEEIFKKLAEGR